MLHTLSEPSYGALPEAGPAPATKSLRAQDLSWIVDEIDYGVLVVDEAPVVHFANRCAQELLDDGRLLRVRDGRLQVGPVQQPLLRRSIERAAAGLRSMLVLEDEMGVAVLPWQGPQRPPPGHTRAVVVLGRSRLGERLTVQWFARCHRLTPTETSLLEMLCDGDSPTRAAGRFGVAISTVRTHIASIRAKTSTASLGALLCRVARQPPMRSALRPSSPR